MTAVEPHNIAAHHIKVNIKIIAVSFSPPLFSHHMLHSPKKKQIKKALETRIVTYSLKKESDPRIRSDSLESYNSITSPTSITLPFLASNDSINLYGS